MPLGRGRQVCSVAEEGWGPTGQMKTPRGLGPKCGFSFIRCDAFNLLG